MNKQLIRAWSVITNTWIGKALSGGIGCFFTYIFLPWISSLDVHSWKFQLAMGIIMLLVFCFFALAIRTFLIRFPETNPCNVIEKRFNKVLCRNTNVTKLIPNKNASTKGYTIDSGVIGEWKFTFNPSRFGDKDKMLNATITLRTMKRHPLKRIELSIEFFTSSKAYESLRSNIKLNDGGAFGDVWPVSNDCIENGSKDQSGLKCYVYCAYAWFPSFFEDTEWLNDRLIDAKDYINECWAKCLTGEVVEMFYNQSSNRIDR